MRTSQRERRRGPGTARQRQFHLGYPAVDLVDELTGQVAAAAQPDAAARLGLERARLAGAGPGRYRPVQGPLHLGWTSDEIALERRASSTGDHRPCHVAHPGAPRVDSWKNAIASFGVGTAGWCFFDGILVAMHFETLGFALQCIAIALFVGHATLPWLKLGWRVAEASWAVLALVMLRGLWNLGWLLALVLIPLASLLLLLRLRRTAFARYDGLDPGIAGLRPAPPRGPCQRCGDPESHFVAPRICISAGIYTYVYSGQVRNLCRHHARVHAIPAAIVSLVVGSMGFPFGVLYGPISAAKNIVEGGDRVSLSDAHEARWKSQLEGDAHGFLQAGAPHGGIFFVSGLASLAILEAVDAAVGSGALL